MSDCITLHTMNESWADRIQRANVINILRATCKLPDLIHSSPNELVDIIEDIAKEASKCLNQMDYTSTPLYRCENCHHHTLGAGPAADGYIYCKRDKKDHCKEHTCKHWEPIKKTIQEWKQDKETK